MPKSRQHHAEEDLSPDAGTAPNVIKISSRLGSYDFGDRRLRLNQRLNPVFNPGNHVAKHHRFLVPSHSPPTLNGNSKSLSNPNTRGELRPSFCCVAFNRIRSAVCVARATAVTSDRLWTRQEKQPGCFRLGVHSGGRIKNQIELHAERAGSLID
jgi:hypothetical protein